MVYASSNASTVSNIKAIVDLNAVRSHQRLRLKQEKDRERLAAKKPNARHYMTYQTPLVWEHVWKAVSCVGWDHIAITEHLKTHDKDLLFTRIKCSLIKEWIDPVTKNQWNERMQRKIASWGPLGSSGRSRILSHFPTLLESIKGHLIGMRDSGMPISVPMARAVILGHIHQSQPDLLTTFKRKSTRANRKEPEDADDQCERAFFRFVYNVEDKGITYPDKIVNYDHAGVSLVPMSEMTWAETGKKQVDLQVKGDKRQMTLVAGSTPGGTVLPFQSIWGGSADGALPSKNAHKRDAADALGIKFTHGDTRHWASLQTSKEYIDQIFRVHIDRVIKERNLPKDAWCLLKIDCWPTHIAKGPDSFLAWMKKRHPRVLILFVPPGCTGRFQAADVGLQCWNKHLIRQSAIDFFVTYTTHQLVLGTAPEKILLPIGVPVVRDASVAWQIDALLRLQSKPDTLGADARFEAGISPGNASPAHAHEKGYCNISEHIPTSQRSSQQHSYPKSPALKKRRQRIHLYNEHTRYAHRR